MRRIGLFLLVLSLLCPFSGSVASMPEGSAFGRVQMVLFYSGTSEGSLGIIEGLLPSLSEVYDVDVRQYDVDIQKNDRLLMAYERKYGKTAVALPVIFLGEDVLAGQQEIMERLESVVARYGALGGCEFPALSEIEKEDHRVLSHPVYMVYFTNEGCALCERVSGLIRSLRGRYRGLVVKEIDIDTVEGKILNESMCERMRVAEAKRLTAPSVFFSRDALVGEQITASALEGLIERYSNLEPTGPPWEVAAGERDQAESRIAERFKALGLATILGAGLIDGINPCAFATLIFFVSYLAFVGRERHEILLVGLVFSLSVFGTYFLMGLGFLRFFQSLVLMPLLSRWVYLGAIGLALVFGAISLYDYGLCRRGRSSEILLQMPAVLRDRVRGVIRREVRVNRYLLAAAATGFVVSILELACTGQVYLPTILFVSRASELRVSAIGCLALYNIMFVIPLVGVFCLAYFGTGSERLSAVFQRHVSWVKLATSVFFFVLAAALSLTMF